MAPTKKLLILIIGLTALATVQGCAGYRIGNQALFYPNVKTVHVPVFVSDSFRQFLGERMTEAVIKEVESRSPYKVAPYQTADSILQGKILRDRKRINIESDTDEGRDIQYDMVIEVSWTDRYGRPLMKSQQLKINQFSHFVPEGGQSLSTAQQELINKAARDIVSQMEIPW